jgi:cytochrome c oxidase subunit 2
MAGDLADVLSAPLGYLRTYGPKADPATALTWGLMILSIAVVTIVSGLVIAGVLLRRSAPGLDTAAQPVGGRGGGLTWIYVGLALTMIALTISLVWTMEVLAAVNAPATPPRLTLEVTGRQWWWEVHYLGPGGQTFATAYDIHIPVGEPVLVKLHGADVIHSFWVPALTGKTDTIPGRTNATWLQADQAGIYLGQCTEYCGLQHAHMALRVIAESPAAFEAWRSAQARAAPEPVAPQAVAGRELVVAHCGACHTVRGTEAGGEMGPDLTHLMSRGMIAAGAARNTPGDLAGWIANPQAIKPGTRMPATWLSGPQLAQATAYLETLR